MEPPVERNANELQEWSACEITAKILDGRLKVTPSNIRTCWGRVRQMRKELRDRWILPDHEDWGLITDWLLATLIARENVLLLGPPGVAKNEIATSAFELLGLKKPGVETSLTAKPMSLDATDPYSWWKARSDEQRPTAKYFHYQLNRFTQIEELFGPVEIALLRRGLLMRVNFGMITGPGVRGAFIDEIFKASGALLNSLLMLLNERAYFNWGGMQPADLACTIAASNELPGAFGGLGATGGHVEDFHTLYALLDRLVIRLHVPLPSGTDAQANTGRVDCSKSSLGRATDLAIKREAHRFVTGVIFPAGPVSCINDILLLGRAMLQDLPETPSDESIFEKDSADKLENTFLPLGAALKLGATNLATGHISWTISPRKLKALFKVSRAYALVTADDSFSDIEKNTRITITGRALRVFHHIWDSPLQCDALSSAVETQARTLWR